MSWLAGLDLSTKAIHACLIPLDPDGTAPPILRVAVIAQADKRAERLRNVSKAVHDVLLDPDGRSEVVSVWIEKPPIFTAARGRMKTGITMSEIYGAACASVPWRVTAVAGLQPQEWRNALGLIKSVEGWKHTSALVAYSALGITADEHHADAACIALAGRQLTWAHDRRVNP